MNEHLTVKSGINIMAPASKVWEVLTKSEFIRQWDDIPEGFTADSLSLGSVLEWAGYSMLTVKSFEPNKLLYLSLYSLKWDLPPSSYDIGYTYNLSTESQFTLLTVEIGDFSQLPEGEKYYQSSLEFVNIALKKIKGLSEM
ncbi:SRPBCC domain-containing protein [Peribacillus alkalitolerans]|uniref:SRPBCC domain-containing protein n=1 Tax=Peribacillus alkalitolerans TaxID=1550385 RepID=UPI0013D1425D|nr:SRPBCC domain-containing protein [Peribacillus alkalitolerans]